MASQTQYLGKRLGFILAGQLLCAPVMGKVSSVPKLILTANLTEQEAAKLVEKLNQGITR